VNTVQEFEFEKQRRVIGDLANKTVIVKLLKYFSVWERVWERERRRRRIKVNERGA
jgi:hypothetical protein